MLQGYTSYYLPISLHVCTRAIVCSLVTGWDWVGETERERGREGERALLLPINRSVAVTKASSHHLHRRAEHLLTLSAYLLHSVSEPPQSTQPTTPSPPSLFHLLIFYFFPESVKHTLQHSLARFWLKDWARRARKTQVHFFFFSCRTPSAHLPNMSEVSMLQTTARARCLGLDHFLLFLAAHGLQVQFLDLVLLRAAVRAFYLRAEP